MKNNDTEQEKKPRPTEKQRLIVGWKELCEKHGKTWNEHYLKLNGNKKIFYEINREKNKRTLDKPEFLLEIIEEYKNLAEKNSAIARIVLNVPGEWEINFPDITKISVNEKGKAVLYQEIDCKENLEELISLLLMKGTDKISILLC